MKENKKKIFCVTYCILSTMTIFVLVLIVAGVQIPGMNRVVISGEDYMNYKQVSDLLSLKKKIEENYYIDVDQSLLQEGAIRGMFLSLPDGYSRYLSKEELEQKNRRNHGESIGIGIEIQHVDRKYVITDVLENMPAKNAGLLPGDIILSVNGIEMNEDNYSKILEAIRDNKKDFFIFGDLSKIQMSIQRNGEILEYTVDRTLTVEQTVFYHQEDHIAMIRISRFTSETYKEFSRVIREIDFEDTHGIILDLRGNPGGLVDEANKIAGAFLGKSKILYYTVDNSDEKTPHYSTNSKVIDSPVVVLIDSKTASASEILVGALKSHDAATIVGSTSFGKGIIQTTFTRINGDGYQITTSEYLTPNDEKIHKKGINPDIEITIDASLEENTSTSSNEVDVVMQKAKELLQ